MPRAKPRSRQPIPRKKPVRLAPRAAPKPVPVATLPLLEEGQKRVLHFGWHSASPGRLPKDFQGEAWHEARIDLDASVSPDMLGAPYRMEGIADHSAEAIWMPQLLQRFLFHQVIASLKEARRVLKEAGFLVFTVPNAQLAASYIATEQPAIALYASGVGPITPLDLLWGLRVGQKNGEAWNCHRSGFTPESLGMLLRDEGFSNIQINPRGYEITAVARSYSHDHPDRVERVSITRSDQAAKAPKVTAPVTEAAIHAATRPRFAAGGKGRPDEIDLPPVVWTPLGLSKD